MSNTSRPIPPAALNTNPMANIIDSLKRLERAGADNSKTTKKLMDSAAALEQMICTACAGELKENISITSGKGFGFYDIKFSQEEPDGALYRQFVRVSASRNAALGFSADLANGLLEEILGNLEERTCKSEQGIDPLKRAAAALNHAYLAAKYRIVASADYEKLTNAERAANMNSLARIGFLLSQTTKHTQQIAKTIYKSERLPSAITIPPKNLPKPPAEVKGDAA